MDTDQIIQKVRFSKSRRTEVVTFLLNDNSLQSGLNRVVKNLMGDTQDFDEIRNLTFVQFFKNILKFKDFEIGGELNTYLFNIARYICLVKMRSKNETFHTVFEELKLISDQINIDLKLLDKDKHIVADTLSSKVDFNCIQLITLSKAGYSDSELVKVLGFSDVNAVKKKKMACMNILSHAISDNPAFKSLL